MTSYTQLPTSEVIRACRECLQGILEDRQELVLRDKLRVLEQANRLEAFFFWRPRKQHTLENYPFPEEMEDEYWYVFGRQEGGVRKLLTLAKATHESTLLVSAEDFRLIASYY